MKQRLCHHCGAFLPSDKPRHAKYCSRVCQQGANRSRHIQTGNARTRNHTGASSELYVASVLMLHGWDVYRALGPNSLADLVAVKGDLTYRIEVKSRAYYVSVSGVKTPQDTRIEFDGSFDLLARVNVLEGEIAWETPDGNAWHPELDVA